MFLETFRKILQKMFSLCTWKRKTKREQLNSNIKLRKSVRCALLISSAITTILVVYHIGIENGNVLSIQTLGQISTTLPPQNSTAERTIECALTIKLIISPDVTSKADADNLSESLHFSKLAQVLKFLQKSVYTDSHVCLHFVVLPDEENHINGVKSYLAQFKWAHGNTRDIYPSTHNDLETITKLWDMDYDDKSLMVIIDVRYVISPIRMDWFHMVKQQTIAFCHCYEIISHSTVFAESVKELRQHAVSSKNAVLWQGVVQNGILILSNRATWNTFVNWLQSERGYWYLWPTAREPRFRSDLRWNAFNATTVAPWTMWFSRFSALYDVYTVYPIREKSLFKKAEAQTFSICNLLNRVSLNGTTVFSKPFSRIEDGPVHSIWKFSRKYEFTVSLTIVNQAFLETAQSWLCNVDEGGFRPPGLVWVAIDEVSFRQLADIPNSETVRLSSAQGRENALDFGKKGYWCLMLERTKLLRDLLNAGITVFLFETDQVWLRDPLPFIRRLRGNGNEVDLIATLDAGRELGGNFLVLNPSLPMRKLYNEVYRRFEDEFRIKNVESWGPKQIKLIANDQTILTHLALYDQTFKRKFPIILRILDQELFACGQWYRNSTKYNTTRSKSPIMINNNWISGVSQKKRRLIKFGHWFLMNGTCNSTLVRYALRENEERLKLISSHLQGKNTERNVYVTVNQGVDSAPNITFLSNMIHEEKLSL